MEKDKRRNKVLQNVAVHAMQDNMSERAHTLFTEEENKNSNI